MGRGVWVTTEGLYELSKGRPEDGREGCVVMMCVGRSPDKLSMTPMEL